VPFRYSGYELFWLFIRSALRRGGAAKASVTFRVPSLLVVQQRWASLQRAPVAGVPYLVALSKSSLNGVLGGRGAARSL